MQWTAESIELACDGGQIRSGVQIRFYSEEDAVARGDTVEVIADLAPPQRFQNHETGPSLVLAAERGIALSGGAHDARVAQAASGLYAWIDRWRRGVRGAIIRSFDERTAPMVRAMVLGESDLAEEDDAAFRASGLSHLLAVSGMHLVLVVLGLVSLFQGVLVRMAPWGLPVSAARCTAILALPLVWVYAEFAGAGGSTLRAAWMMTLVLLARVLGRKSDGVRAFALSLIAMWMKDPLAPFDMSFALSAAATGGLLSFARPWGEKFTQTVPFAPGPARMFATTLAASVACTPLLLRLSPHLGVGGLMANLLAVPIGEGAALPLCLVHPLLWWWEDAAAGSAMVTTGALSAVRAIARLFSAPILSLPLPPPTGLQTAALALGLSSLALFGGRARRAGIALAALVYAGSEVSARSSLLDRPVLRATFLDVGQGDATLVDFPDGTSMLIDGGGLVGSPLDTGTRVIAPVLAARRQNSITTMVLSHPHPDHVTGLASGTSDMKVGAFWDNGEGERRNQGGAYAALLGRLHKEGVPVLHPDTLCGHHAMGGADVEVLAPCPGPDPDRGDNDNSLVLRITFGACSLLLAGDAEREEETELLSHPERLRAEVLKVGHHGSRTSSSPPFLAAVHPSFAVVSTGVRNRFGHPHEESMRALVGAGARVFRTDRDGAILASTDGVSWNVGPR